MAFKARATQRDDGNYDLSYGKGSKKITAVLEQVGTKWRVQGTDDAPRLKREVVADWEKRAVAAYGGDTSTSTSEQESPHTQTPTTAPHPQLDLPLGEPDKVSQAEREFFAHLSTLDRKLTPAERSEAIGILKYLIGGQGVPTSLPATPPPTARRVPPPPPFKGPPSFKKPVVAETHDSNEESPNEEVQAEADEGSEAAPHHGAEEEHG